MNKQGQTTNIFNFMIVAFLVVVLFAGLIYAQGLIYNVFQQVGIANDLAPHPTYTVPCVNNQSQMCTMRPYANMTLANEQIFGQVNNSIQNLRLVALVYILVLAVVIIVTNALMRIHPIWFFAYVMIALLAIIFAPTISNAYQSLLESGMMGGILDTFGPVNFLIKELPTVVMVISVLGGIFLFINLMRGSTGEATLG